MSYFILLLIFILLAVGVFVLFHKDVISPTFISSCMFAFSVFLAIIGLNSWNSSKHLSIELIIALTCGLLAFFMGEFLSRKIIKTPPKEKKIKPVIINHKLYFLTLIFIITTIILLILEIKRICHFYGYDSNFLPNLLSFYRTKIGLFSTDLVRDNIDINFIVKQMKKTCDVLCVIWMYIFLTNYNKEKGLKYNLKNFLPIILAMGCTLLTSGRSLLMHMLVAFVMMYLLLHYMNGNLFHKKVFLKIGGIVFVCLGLFCIIVPLTGRHMKSNPIDYVSFYLGSPIPSFHEVYKKESKNDYFGEMTFSGVYYSLNKLHIVNYLKPRTHEWTNFGKFNSNVYTSLRSYYNDFGIMGIIICQFIFGFVISSIYLYIQKNKTPLGIIIYSYYSYILIDQIRDEQFFNLLSTSTVAYLLIILVLYFVFVFDKTKWNRG